MGWKYLIEKIRNFCIIAHIDHGKSTLADRLLELTGKNINQAQVLDTLEVERRRGITVKAQTVSMQYQGFLLNLIDTPGHVDFSYQVSRSLKACQGAVLLVDGISGIQAQTFSTFYQALEAQLEIIPVINKIDSPYASIQRVEDQLQRHFDLENPFAISAMTGFGVPQLMEGIIKRVPHPNTNSNTFRGFLFDSWYESFKGVICIMKVIDGSIQKHAKIKSFYTGKIFEISDLGKLQLELTPTESLRAGEVGYFILGMENTAEALIGDTFSLIQEQIQPLEGFKQPKCMVYAGVFPEGSEDFSELSQAVKRLNLEDRSLVIQTDQSTALGQGFKCGFLGMLHMDIFKQRLQTEHDQSIIMTSPTVPYKILHKDGNQIIIQNPNDLPDRYYINKFLQPMTEVTLVFPNEFISNIIQLCLSHRGSQIQNGVLDSVNYYYKFKIPLAELIIDFYDKLKSMTRGMGTLDYQVVGYQQSSLGRLNILINGEVTDALTAIVHSSRSYQRAKSLCARLKELLPRQQFDVPIQGQYQGKIIARQTVKAFRKDVTAKLYGGDQTRKDKLLKKQKKGKKRMKLMGSIQVESKTFQKILKTN